MFSVQYRLFQTSWGQYREAIVHTQNTTYTLTTALVKTGERWTSEMVSKRQSPISITHDKRVVLASSGLWLALTSHVTTVKEPRRAM